MVFGRKPKLPLNLEIMPDIKVWGTFKDYYNLLKIDSIICYNLLQDFKSKILAMINKDKNFFQYKNRDLVWST